MQPMNRVLRFVLVASGLGLLLVLGLANAGQAWADGPKLPPAQTCAECHAGAYQDWLLSKHRMTLYSLEFQDSWERARRSTECLACHTTGFDPEKGPEYWGVTCAACHAPSGEPVDPDAEREHVPYSVPENSDACAVCHSGGHTVTYTDWAAGPHNGYRPTDCFDCHDAHSATLVEDDITTLCGSCHFEPVPHDVPYMHYEGDCTDCHAKNVSVDNVHMHGGSEAVANCLDCHMLTSHDSRGYVTQSGHQMTVSLDNCVACHGALHDMQADDIAP
jgi:predicted CXXCH cytochrome family protein